MSVSYCSERIDVIQEYLVFGSKTRVTLPICQGSVTMVRPLVVDGAMLLVKNSDICFCGVQNRKSVNVVDKQTRNILIYILTTINCAKYRSSNL